MPEHIGTIEPLDPRTYRQAQKCVHCGLCLPACPTYTQDGLETDSPRGRIHIMRALSDGRIAPTASVVKHLDLCLDCRACETACPSSVVYHELIEETRHKLAARRRPAKGQRLADFMIYHVMPYPYRLKLALLPARIAQRLGLYGLVMKVGAKFASPSMMKMQQMLPDNGPLWPRGLARHHAPAGDKRLTVGVLATCVGSVMQDPINRMTVELLQALGCEVVVPRGQGCCGAIHHHGGRPEPAMAMARRNIVAFESCDVVVNNVAGCGAMLKEYDALLRDDAQWSERAAAFVKKVRDINELLVAIDPPPAPHAVERTVTYHDACHLAHAQKVTSEPRKLLAKIPGLKVVPLIESDICCGAAGTYNLTQPQMSGELAERKLRHIQATGASAVVSSNIGCTMQIASEARRRGIELEVLHPVELLHAAYCGGVQGVG